MKEHLLEAAERAINKLVADFQGNPDRFWNERDLHWSLFYRLKQENAVQEDYATQLIRAEFPTLKKFGESTPARGHYDLVVLEPSSVIGADVKDIPSWAPWSDWLPKVKLLVAVEIKLWLARLPIDRADWDIQKLTESPNNIQNAYFLNFVQLNFKRQQMKDYYRDLRRYLMDLKARFPPLKILCAPNEVRVQPNPRENWLSLS